VEFPSTRVLPVNGLLHKLGLITLGVRREVFDAIGVFNCTTKASDDEFFRRLQAYAASGAGTIEQQPSPSRAAYVGTPEKAKSIPAQLVSGMRRR